MFVTCAASLVALFAVAGGLYVFQIRNFRQTLERELRTFAQMMADSGAPALALNDPTAVRESLAHLTVKPEIMNATVLGKDGARFASSGSEPAGASPDAGAPAGIVDRGDSWMVVQPIVRKGERIGTFFLNADYAGPRGELQRVYLGVTAAVLCGSLAIVVLLTLRLQAFITGPIRLLAEASEAVASKHDYSVRVQSAGRDELGQLTTAFNVMLGRIQGQDAALQTARSEAQKKVVAFDREIKARQRAQTAQARLTAIIEATPDFVGSADSIGRVLYLNPAARRMIGLEDDADISSLTVSDLHPGWAARIVSTEGIPAAIHDGSWVGETAVRHRDGQEIHVSHVLIAHKSATGGLEHLSTIMRDVSDRKEAEARLADMNKQLLDASRQAGMAEVATGVLHNVGNVLNSVNISAATVIEKLRGSKIEGLAKAVALLSAHEADLAGFLTTDPQGQRLPGYLRKLSGFLIEENASARGELDHLGKNVEHIKQIVAMQQTYARATGFLEDVPPEKLVDDVLQLNTASFARHGINIARDFQPAPPVRVDKHKVLQILINLLRNAKHAVEDAGQPDPRIHISVDHAGDRVRIAVTDNGVGIAAQHLTSVFRHGFTTKKNGHGFGLHSGANAAKEMGGALIAESPGPGLGATFTLELPVAVSTLN